MITRRKFFGAGLFLELLGAEVTPAVAATSKPVLRTGEQLATLVNYIAEETPYRVEDIESITGSYKIYNDYYMWCVQERRFCSRLDINGKHAWDFRGIPVLYEKGLLDTQAYVNMKDGTRYTWHMGNTEIS